MHEVWAYTLGSVLLVSAISLIGILALSIKKERLKKILIYFISFSAGALFGDAFIHLLPEVVREQGFGLQVSFSVIGGVALFFILEKVIQWRHCHMPITQEHVHSFAYMNLFGDGLHNLIDGLIIAASYLVSVPIGIATTLAVVLHEIPQEIGDYSVLVHGGFSRKRALLLNFVTALAAFLGAAIALLMHSSVDNIDVFLLPFAAGGFVYIAGSDLIPELHKDSDSIWKSLGQVLAFLAGIGVMAMLLIVG